jgi:uncharacterized protein (TIGR03083 family)
MTWSHLRYCDAIGPEIERLAAVSRPVDPTKPVPTCPDWTMASLLQHVGTIHRWVTAMVAQLTPKRLRRSDLDLGIPDDERDLAEWIAAGATPLLTTLRNADPDAGMWAWGIDQHARFWSRRLVHETCIHRVDAERTAGVPSQIDPAIAADGIDELLGNLPPAASFSPTVEELRGKGETLLFGATDTGTTWLITLHPDGFDWERAGGEAHAHATLTGSVADLYLALYGRLPVDHPGVERSGDRAVLDLWLTNATI